MDCNGTMSIEQFYYITHTMHQFSYRMCVRMREKKRAQKICECVCVCVSDDLNFCALFPNRPHFEKYARE